MQKNAVGHPIKPATSGGLPFGVATLDDVVTTAELAGRPRRAPNHAAEARALVSLARAMASDPTTVMQRLVDAALELTGAQSAGISVLEPSASGEAMFRWRATAGAFSPFVGGTLPRTFSPCGVVLDRNAAQLVRDPARYWPYVNDLRPEITEVLLVPFHDGERPIGTVWVVSHAEAKRFDSEDERLVTSLSQFASAAVQTLTRLAAADDANRAKDYFLAVLSHELRTPLSPALLTATGMESDPMLPAAIRADAALIRRNIEAETQLIDDLLDVSRITAGKLEMRCEVIDLHNVIDECVGGCRATMIAEKRNVTLRCDLAANHHTISGSPTRLRQVMSNLLSNAVKFTPDGGEITVTTSDQTDGVRVAVRDTGCGITADVLPQVFKAFEQGGRETTRQYSGLGLGLAIAKGIMEAHGGRIAAESDGRGMGTTMTLVIPTIPDGVPATAFAPVAAEAGVAMNILLVEDHEDSLHAMTRLLRKLSHRVETATSVRDALAVAERFNFDLLISDVGLPDGSGLNLMRSLRAARAVTGIALTGYGTAGDIAETTAAGFCMHLTKPVRLTDLIQALKSMSVGDRRG